MAASYIRTVRAEQPEGPYLLGGMCAGGLIAFEMARQLMAQGAQVGRVLMMDSATPNAERVGGGAVRSSRLREAIMSARRGRGFVGGTLAVGGVFVRKLLGVVSYELTRRRALAIDRRRMQTLRRVLADGTEWPASLPGLDFRTIYNHAESAYRPARAPIPSLLIRATEGVGSDVPYVRVFKDPTLGWAPIVDDLVVVDVEGGHASMLQEPQAASLVGAILPHLQASDARAAA